MKDSTRTKNSRWQAIMFWKRKPEEESKVVGRLFDYIDGALENGCIFLCVGSICQYGIVLPQAPVYSV